MNLSVGDENDIGNFDSRYVFDDASYDMVLVPQT